MISPLALEAVRRIDALFDIERAINGQSAERRRTVRQELSAPLVADLESWLREQRPKLSRGNDLAKAMDYMLKRWPAFTRFLADGRICLSNNAAERALRGIALGRKSWLFAGSDRGGQRAAAMYSLIVTAKMNDVDPQAWLADVLARIATHPAFPRGTNVELACVSSDAIDLVVWERGVGITMACGTGACATVAVACDKGLVPKGRPHAVRLPGGRLLVTIDDDGRATMRGPARRVFTGAVA